MIYPKMRLFADVCQFHENKELDWNHIHLYLNLKKYINIGKLDLYGSPPTDFTHYLILDVRENLDNDIDKLVYYKKQGIKVVILTFDPMNFPRIKKYIGLGAIDKVIITDRQFMKEFSNIKGFVSDYFVNSDWFFENSMKSDSDVCMHGHLNYARKNEYGCHRLENVPSLKWLYMKTQKFNGCAVHDSGYDAEKNLVIHHNKGKAIETLMSGINSYCQPGIKTKRYDKYLKKYEQIPNPVPIDFEQKEIITINDLTIQEFCYEVYNT